MIARALFGAAVSVGFVAFLVHVAGDDHDAATLALLAGILALVSMAEWLSRYDGGER